MIELQTPLRIFVEIVFLLRNAILRIYTYICFVFIFFD